LPRPARRLALHRCFPLALVLILALGCKVKLISDYDDVTDRAVTELQRKVEGFVHRMESSAGTPAGEYAQNKPFYIDARTDVGAIQVRARAIDHNERTLQSLDHLKIGIDHLEQLHRSAGTRGLTEALAEPALAALNTQFTAIIKLELAKKRS
jgi:hypothetical protein